MKEDSPNVFIEEEADGRSPVWRGRGQPLVASHGIQFCVRRGKGGLANPCVDI